MLNQRHLNGHEVTIKKQDLIAGDVLMCYKNDKDSELAFNTTGSKYAHVAIYLGENNIAEAIPSGIKKTSIDVLIRMYDHLAVLRQELFQHRELVQKMKYFIDQLIKNNTIFDDKGIDEKVFIEKQSAYQDNMHKLIIDYFEGKMPEVSPHSSKYFCSQLIAAIFIYTGIIVQGATFIYNPEQISPANINDATFGSFIGYLVKRSEYNIPENDDFYNELMDIEITE